VLATSVLKKEGAGCGVSNMSAWLILSVNDTGSTMRLNILTSFMMMGVACVILLHHFFPLVC
jgi:hypothetical protein